MRPFHSRPHYALCPSSVYPSIRQLLLLLLLLKCQDYSAAITQMRGHLTKFISKTVVQLNADVCWRSEWTAPSQQYDWRKSWDLVSLRNVKSEEQARVSGGRLVPCPRCSHRKGAVRPVDVCPVPTANSTRGQSNLTKRASRGAHSPVRGHPRGSKVVPLNSWGRVSY